MYGLERYGVSLMENSKLKDRLKQQKNDRILQFIKEHIRYFAAGALFVIMVVVLAMCTKPGDGEGILTDDTSAAVEEYQVDAHEDVNALIRQYYAAYAAGDVATVTSIASPVQKTSRAISGCSVSM